MKKIFVVLFVALLFMASCSKKIAISYEQYNSKIVLIEKNAKIMIIRDENQREVMRDTIIGDPLIVNLPPDNILITFNEKSPSKSLNNNKQISVDGIYYDSYVVWLKYDFTTHGRLWNLNESLTTILF